MKKLKFHQGDVIGKTIEIIPEEAVKTENKPLALGSSNHAHVMTGNVQRYELKDRVFFNVMGDKAVLQHTNHSNLTEEAYKSVDLLPVQDHNPIILPTGNYEFFIQKAYNPYKKVFERVVD